MKKARVVTSVTSGNQRVSPLEVTANTMTSSQISVPSGAPVDIPVPDHGDAEVMLVAVMSSGDVSFNVGGKNFEVSESNPIIWHSGSHYENPVPDLSSISVTNSSGSDSTVEVMVMSGNTSEDVERPVPPAPAVQASSTTQKSPKAPAQQQAKDAESKGFKQKQNPADKG